MTSHSRGLVSALVVLALTVGPSSGCGDDGPSSDGTQGGSTGGGSTGPGPTTMASADTTAGTTTDATGSTSAPATSSSSGDPDDTGTTQGVSATDSSGGTTDGTTEGSSSEGSSSEGSSSEGSSESSDSGGMLPDVSGEFLFALATPIDASLPLQYIATFDFVPGGAGGGTIDVELQPLALDVGSATTPRTPFGPPMVFGGIPVAGDGTFSINIGGLVIEGETNPLTGSDANAINVVLDVQILDADELCGTASGTLTSPLMFPLAGTTFGAVRVASPMPAALPVVFPVSC